MENNDIKNDDIKNDVNYQKLTKPQQAIVDVILENLGSGCLWHKGWHTLTAAPTSLKGTSYHGMNQLLLWTIDMKRGYLDNRWMTFNAMDRNGWRFKVDEDGHSLGSKAGVPVELFVEYDSFLHKPFCYESIQHLSQKEKEDYMTKYVYHVRRTYTVFNCSIIEGVPKIIDLPQEHPIEDAKEIGDKFIALWSDKMCRIEFSGGEAKYSVTKDKIYMPPHNVFVYEDEFYTTAFHEIIHSTYGKTRLDMKQVCDMQTDEYAFDELVAEIGSLFIAQGLGIDLDVGAVENSSYYISEWDSGIRKNPSILFDAIKTANKCSKYALDFYAQETGEKIDMVVLEGGEVND